MVSMSVSAQLFDWPCTEEGEVLSDVVSPHLQRLLQFARTVPGKTEGDVMSTNLRREREKKKTPSDSVIIMIKKKI